MAWFGQLKRMAARRDSADLPSWEILLNKNVATILIVDDDADLCRLLREYLTTAGFAVETVQDGLKGVEAALTGRFALVILDVMLPDLEEFEALRQIRAASRVPVLMLTARGEDIDRIVGLEIGADDYLPKPFNPRELLARLRAILRRVDGDPHSGGEPERLVVGDVRMVPGTRTVLCQDQRIELTTVEFEILEVLLRHAGKVVTRDDLVRQALGRKLSHHDRSIDVHVSSLRRKLGRRDDQLERIQTIRNTGYLYTASL